MQKFYFTYGIEGHPFVGGWTEVIAEDRQQAVELFALIHPKNENGFLPYCTEYSEEQFQRTRMAGGHGSFGRFCHETIELVHIMHTHTAHTEEEKKND